MDVHPCGSVLRRGRAGPGRRLPRPPGAPAYSQSLAQKYGINRPGGQFLFQPFLATSFVAFNHARPAFEGPGQIPLEKAVNYAIDRTELVRTSGFLALKRTDQLLPPPLARRASLYPLNPAPVAAKRWLSRAKLQPKELVLYASNSPAAVAHAQVLDFNLRQIGIELRVKYFDTDEVNRRIGIPGEPYDLYLYAWGADYTDPAGFLVPLLENHQQANGSVRLPAKLQPYLGGRTSLGSS